MMQYVNNNYHMCIKKTLLKHNILEINEKMFLNVEIKF